MVLRQCLACNAMVSLKLNNGYAKILPKTFVSLIFKFVFGSRPSIENFYIVNEFLSHNNAQNATLIYVVLSF